MSADTTATRVTGISYAAAQKLRKALGVALDMRKEAQ